ncbi:hypothetical protein BIV60_15035 [Bacillus sp. MUM 116]|uniref:hypothetical protein n=1 Tax=Bacillus sp. MUM 116 TaxID=1678002 RepID=UPI0008F5BF31|nr:hypothetical protein [Bacillus sp. MUM 116]OIK12993.1 hypothetical protein BIV60_15035 [Bacillus sp. MUM 116]
MENDKELKREPSGEIDRFTGFMFGSHRQRKFNNNDEHPSQEFPEQTEETSFHRTTNRMDDWLFGFREKGPPTLPQNNLNQVESLLNQIDLMQVMETYDMFVATTKQLKPLFNDISPYFHRLVKKIKSTK